MRDKSPTPKAVGISGTNKEGWPEGLAAGREAARPMRIETGQDHNGHFIHMANAS